MKRRQSLLSCLPMVVFGARAQAMPQVGVLTPWRSPSPLIPTWGALEAGLAEGGWNDGLTLRSCGGMAAVTASGRSRWPRN